MLKSKFVASEIAKDTTLCTQLERLNEFRTQLIAEELSAYNGNAALDSYTSDYKTEGWRMIGVMKELMDKNNISVRRKQQEWSDAKRK